MVDISTKIQTVMGLPVLDTTATVRFASQQALAQAWDQSLGRGVLIVAPELALEPLQIIAVVVTGAGLDAPLALRAEVVHLEPQRAMLRLVDGPVPRPASLDVQPTPAPVVNPFAAATTTTPPRPAAVASALTPMPFDFSSGGQQGEESASMPAPSPKPKPTAPPAVAPARLPLAPTPAPWPSVNVTSFPAPRAQTPASTMAAAVSRMLNEGSGPVPASTEARSPGDALAATHTQQFDAGPLQGPAVVATSLPPYFSGDALRFQSMSDLRGARHDLLTLGALLAVCDDRPPARPIDVRVMVGNREARAKLRCMLSAAQPGTAVLQVEDKASIAVVFDELDPGERSSSSSWPSSPADDAAARVSQGRQLVLPMSGKLWNPTTPAEILRLPVHRLVTEADLKRPSVPLLLRWLRTTKGVLKVDLSADGQPVHSIICVDGRELRSPVSMQTLGRALGAPVYDYDVTELPRAPSLTNTGRTLHLIAEVVRALLSPHDPEAIAAAFPSNKDARLVRAVTSVVEALGFQGPHARIIKSSLQGDEQIESITRGATGARVAWDVLVVLELFGGLTYVTGEPRRPTPATSQSGIGSVLPDALALLSKDHFGVLGLHWSSSPTEVPSAYQKARADYLPGGMKRPASAADADKLLQRLEEAFKVLNDTEARRAYRRATYNMVWAHQAQILVAQAKLALYRKDLHEARNLLLTAQDLWGTPEAQEMLAILDRKT